MLLLLMRYFTFFISFEICVCFIIIEKSQLGLTTFQVLNGHLWLAATILDITNVDTYSIFPILIYYLLIFQL